ncbi:hypothetical protein CFC35_05800 [Streptomyces sp. FBKL.4005]|uniref:hypothetical protein n=1 Tax=Streptomyces sp. FBKL.4005 TaxID=2015515 RepID=UPI000B9676AE|nr:hypothetical protein [Streptomyces sp. FBKL.4005]OYP14079.1 hypothetical protein CFC35_05800 [Streptomyces sp. FBKL.4005]
MVFRIEPQMGAESYKTYAMVSPLSSHFRPATCAEVDCPHYLNGWRVRVEGLTPQDIHAAKTSGRRWIEQRVADGETWLVFEAGQPCFKASQHRTRVDRPPLYIVRDGDHRGNPRGTKARLHQRAADWQEDFAEHQQKLADEIRKG